ncbi:MAG: radical SAM protein [Deltaproteobacteria bacterium]|nr:radical SAM protein [Deltaproteobacteria bacterium]
MAEGPRPAESELPRVVDWTEITLTHRCNQRCFFCYEEARDNATEPDLERVKELLRATAGHAEQVVLCGKEILMRRDVPQIVAYASSLGLKAVVFTNGQALAREGVVEELAEAGCAGVAVSFHFPDAETFARGARISPKGFELILAGLRRVRDYNLAHPERPLPISTESDVFALNVGRLEEMRDTLREALEGAPWRMRLASLLPARTYDIGLDRVLDPLPARREEIAAFVESQPEGIPLGFVKVPLCLLPEGEEHRSLDAQYVYEGTRLTFNHAEADRISIDEASASITRDLASVMRLHPYRWVCRACALAPMCRFERVHWDHPGFGPDREQRPTPYRPEGVAPAALDGLPLPTRRRGAAEVLAPLGASTDGVGRVEALNTFLGGLRYPEEELLSALKELDTGSIRLVDAWSEGPPVLVVRLEIDGAPLDLHLGVPSLRPPFALVDYLDVRPLGDAPPPALLARALRHLATLVPPPPERWAEDTFFDDHLGRLYAALSPRLGEALWPGLGGLGPFASVGLSVDEDRGLHLSLEGPGGVKAELLAHGGDRAGAPPSLGLEVEAGAGAEDLRALLSALGIEASDLSAWQGAGGGLAARDEGAGWRAQGGGGREARGGGGDPSGALTIEVAPKERPEPRYRFHVARCLQGQSYFKRVGDLGLWYSHDHHDKVAEVCAGPILLAMEELAGTPPGAGTLERWAEGLEAASVARRVGGRLDWRLRWSD